MRYQLATKPFSDIKSEYVILAVFENEKTNLKFPKALEFLVDNPKFGKPFESQLLFSKDQKILLLGAGKKEKFDFPALQNWAGAAVKQLLKKTKQLSLLAPPADNLSPQQIAEAVVLGSEIATHDPSKNYKSEYEDSKLSSVEIVVEKTDRGYQEGIARGLVLAESINLARILGDMPANEMTPTYFLNTAKRLAKENKLKISVLNEAQAKKKGMGAFTGVAQGSEEPSYMIALEYKGDLRSKEKWGFAGKGITFDTGGISLKPAASMHEMKYDMSGAAAVLGAIVAASKLKIKANIVSVMAVTENLPGGRAQRPGDIVKSYCGKTAEVLNTDAEGRLVLIDALAFAQKDFKATKLLDLATLTGAVIVALGDFLSGVFGNNPKFTQQVITAGAKVGEKIWEMPMSEEYGEMIKSDFADITNIGHGGSMPSAAGSITAAKFLEAAVKEGTPWVHLDIAGTAWDLKPKPYRGPGATGVGIKTLVELISE